MNSPPSVINCVECGGSAHLASFLPVDEEPEPGTPIAYVCQDCDHRHDLVWEDDDPD